MEIRNRFPLPGEEGFVGPRSLNLQLYEFCDIWVNGGGRLQGYGYTARKAGFDIKTASRKGAEIMNYTLIQQQIYSMDSTNREIKEYAYKESMRKALSIIEDTTDDQISPSEKVGLLISLAELSKDFDKVEVGSTSPLHGRGGNRTPVEEEPTLDEATKDTLEQYDRSIQALGVLQGVDPDPEGVDGVDS